VYLRRSDRTKDGKTHTYWRLVRSVRQGRKVVQQTVAQLGELDAAGRAKARALARAIAGGSAQASLFEETATAETNVPVRLNRIRLERGRVFGDVWLGWTLWCALGLDRLCAELLPEGREAVPWSWMAATLVVGRLCRPSSELYLAERWYPRTALEDLLGLPVEKVNDDRLYRALDRLLPHKETIEKHLVRRLGELFEVDYDLLLYDVTSTYFEGLAEGNELARRGHSRDHRHDCKQVCIALVVTRDGIPLGYELFAGNRTDVTTVEEIVETMETRFGLARRIWVMDRGMTSAENIAWLKRTGRRYLIGTPKSDRSSNLGTGNRCETVSKPSCALGRTAKRCFFCADRQNVVRKSGRSTIASSSAWRPPWQVLPNGSSAPGAGSIVMPSMNRSDVCASGTLAPPVATTSGSSTSHPEPRDCD
jgi:hypothetical protein